MHHDREKALGDQYKVYILRKGLEVEQSLPYTQDQNGLAERSGGVLMNRARALCIESGLPENLWPEFVQTAGYLLNRSPIKALK